ncbi:hypothetical protein CRE_10835 [Caenorhabditis remanei]|uniref:Uncharacterized protein n=1 Tax=Caenorhabditis remanei TaxID=31234 RepID=E3M539_CAERE|nr:hypothetical protein CRE_10835 [Caenorhabditis remanei]
MQIIHKRSLKYPITDLYNCRTAPRTPRPRAIEAKAQENEHEKVKPQQEEKGTKREPKQEFELKDDGKDKTDAEPSTSTPSRAPSLTRRHTPSRKVKTYKSLRE